MKINRHSIFLKINLLFAIAIISVIIVFFTFYFISKVRETGLLMRDAHQVMRMVRTIRKHNPKQLTNILNEEGYNLINDKEKILELAKPITYSKRLTRRIKEKISNGKLKILEFDSKIYFYINLPKHKLLIENRLYENHNIWILFAFLAIVSILLFIYLALRKALKPIKKLEVQIKKFSEGNLDIDTRSPNKDEISAVANQFYEAVQKIQKLSTARKLYLANSMHELKTPITKGKLSLSLMEENSQSKMLNKIFNKLESLVNEMAEIEQITTGDIVMHKQEYKLKDILANAKDLLYLKDEQIIHNISDQKIFCDFKLFSIVVKNLIDNGIKYSSDNKVQINANEHYIKFINLSSKLEHEFSNYLEPFFKGELKKSNQSGFGLGLYIVKQVVNLHGFTLSYKHEDGNNIFKISLKK